MYIITKDITPVTEPVTVQECIDHAYLPPSPQENLIAAFISTARRHIEQYCNVALVPKVIEATAVGGEGILLSLPVDQVLMAKVIQNDVATVLDPDAICVFKSRPAHIRFKDKTPYDTFYIKYNTHIDPDADSYKSYIYVLVTHLYENRTLDAGNISKFNFILDPLKKNISV